MGKSLSPAQRKAVTGSDPATGRLSARAEVCAALATAGLAVRHGRSGHQGYYLSPEGLRQRAALAAADEAREHPPAPEVPVVREGTFTADDGMGTAGPRGVRRAAEVAAAWEGLLSIRAVLLDGVTDVPAPWERERLVHAVALALEAAGCPPAPADDPGGPADPGGTGDPGGMADPGGPDTAPDSPDSAPSGGYTVTSSPQVGAVEVSWRGAPAPDDATRALDECAALLDARGWQCTRHRDRGGRAYLLVSPRRR
jgi:hypothetical protein